MSNNIEDNIFDFERRPDPYELKEKEYHFSLLSPEEREDYYNNLLCFYEEIIILFKKRVNEVKKSNEQLREKLKNRKTETRRLYED